MPALSKRLVNFGAGALTLRMARRLKKPDPGHAAQTRAFAALTARLAPTAFGREAGIEAGMAYEKFRARVAPRAYEQFAPFIARMQRGEAGVLWPGRCAFFAATAGAATGAARPVPVTGEMLAHFRRAGRDALLFYTARAGHGGVFRGRQLFLGGSAALTPLDGAGPSAAYTGGPGGIALLNLPGWAEKHLYEPGAAIARIDDWPARLQAIVERTWNRDITLLAGLPNWLLLLAGALRQKAGGGKNRFTRLQALWPNLECCVHGGLPADLFQDELREALGPGVNFHEVYPAAEGFIAAQDADRGHGLRLLADGGLFFEFLPLREFDEANLAQLGPRAVPLAGAQAGIDYVLLLTTPAGLCRYVLGDIVRFVSTDAPRLVWAGHTGLRLNAFGEQVIERDLSAALLGVCRRHGWQTVNYHVAPLFANSALGQTRGRHEWWIELKTPTVETPTGPLIAAELDAALRAGNPDYAARRQGGGFEPPLVRLVMPGVFEQWMRQARQWDGRHKVPRSLPDRRIADRLSELTKFSAEA